MKLFIRILLFISALFGAFIGFFYIILSALNELQDETVNLLSYLVFFGALLMLVLAFFFRKKLKYIYAILLLVLIIIHIVFFVSLPLTNNIFLIPIVLYLICLLFTVFI